ncbi:MAG: hypothetical protein GXP37_14520, partial [Chloroflexi bacterium]|nr:hypothetical protein [Chloroflexota bacterium]
MNLHRSVLWTGYERRRQLTLLIGDLLLVWLTAAVAVALRLWLMSGTPLLQAFPWPLPSGVYALGFGYLVALYIFDQYDLARDPKQPAAAMILALAGLVGMILAVVITFFWRSLQLGRFVVLIQWPLAMLALYGWRRLFHATVLRLSHPHRVLLVVANPVERGIEAELQERPLGEYVVAGVFMVAGAGAGGTRRLIDDQGRSLEQAIVAEEIDTLVFSARDGFPPQYLEQAIDWKFDGVGVYDAANFYGAMTGRVPIETIDGRWILDHLSQPYGSAMVRRIKRMLDIILALTGLALSLPFWPLLILAIKLDSPGPAIFRQQRLGMRQQPVTIAKFRSMRDAGDVEGEAAYAQQDDPRVTRVGKWLRKTRLDELPQLWNVLQGEMSIVGLRPIRAVNAQRYAESIPYYRLRFSMKPGLTGWPQIRYRYADDDESHLRKFEYELYHIQNA